MQNKIFCYILLKNDSYCGITIVDNGGDRNGKRKGREKSNKEKNR